MTEVRYIGMTFVYKGEWYDLLKAKAKIIEILVRKYESVSGYYTRKIGGIYLEGDRIAGWRYRDDVEFEGLPYFLEEDEYEIVWKDSLEAGIYEVRRYEHWEKIARRISNVAFKSFPPKKYLEKYKIKYEKDGPAFPLGQKEGPEIDIITPLEWDVGACKKYISLDFGTYENYFYSEDEKLNRAVEEFLVDLMREIAMATEPEYGYMDMNEYRPLERDPVCETGRLKIDYYMDYKGEVIINSYLPPLLYLSNEIINKNGGRAFNEYMENQRIRKKIWRIDRLKGGVFYHIGDVVLPAERPQRSYIDIADYLLGDRIEKIKKEIKESEKRDGVLCDY